MFFPKTLLFFLSIFAFEQVSSAAIYGYFFYQQPPAANGVDQTTFTANLPVELSEHNIPSLIPDEPIQEPKQEPSIESPVINQQQTPSSFIPSKQQNESPVKYNFEQNLFAQIKSAQLGNPRYWQPTAQDYFGIFSLLKSALMIDDLVELAQSFLVPEPELDSSDDEELNNSGSSSSDSDESEDDSSESADKKKAEMEDIDAETVLVGNEQDDFEILS